MTTSEEYSPLNEQPVNNYLSALVKETDNGIVDEKRGFEITPGQVKVLPEFLFLVLAVWAVSITDLNLHYSTSTV
jgi:hypothetical protein